MNATSDSQVALLQAARNGQRDALDALSGAFRNYLKLLARAQLGSNSQKRIEPSDLVQETLLDAYRGFDGFQGQTMPELISWLRQILVRKLVDQFKAQRAEKRDPRREISLQRAGSVEPGTRRQSLRSRQQPEQPLVARGTIDCPGQRLGEIIPRTPRGHHSTAVRELVV
jgi:DNA-directed RNA polymerase specialized sigma24 family protein